MSRTINKAGLGLVKHFEGFSAKAYLCPAQILTIGYGHTAGVKQGQKVTKKKAEQLLREDLADAELGVEKMISSSLSNNQFSSLVSFTFNLGLGNLKNSTLRRKLNAGDYDSVPSELAKWVKGGGKTLPGLVRRRAAEAELFLLPDGERAFDESLPMPQSVESTEQDIHAQISSYYLSDSITLQLGSVDDIGDENYVRLSQNVPNSYIYDLQTDLLTLGLTEVGEPDGAFGGETKLAIQSFQKLVGIEINGELNRETKDKIILWLEHGYTKNTPPNNEDDTSVMLESGIKFITHRVPHFSQGDSRWAARTLGNGSSIRREGCAISCIAMILNYYRRNTTPESLDSYLDAHNGYAGNSVKWNIAGQCEENNGIIKLKYGRTEGSRKKVVDYLAERVKKNLPTIVRVDYGIDANLTYNHFVVCIGITVDGEFIMNDPATRKGDGYVNNSKQNIIQQTSRNNGYHIVQLDYYDPL